MSPVHASDMAGGKIDMSDRVHIVNPAGYVGASISAEISYAEAAGKDVTYEHNAT